MQKKDRYKILLEAIEMERSHEENYYQKLSLEKTAKEKELAGILWKSVVINKKHYTVGERIELEIEKTRNLNTNHKFKVGAGAHLIFEAEETRSFPGVISFARKNILRIILNSDQIFKDFIDEKGSCSIELIYDERPYKVMRESIQSVMKSTEQHIIDLREGIRYRDIKNQNLPNNAAHYNSNELNEFQNKALRNAALNDTLSIIHGPPGTGKTTTLVALTKFLVKSENQILVCAPSNNAVDLLARKLSEEQINVLRVGNVTRIGDSIAHLTLDEKAREHNEWQHIKKVKIEAEQARRLAGKYKRSFGAKEKAERNMLYSESKELKRWARDLEDKLMTKILDDAQVICTTLISTTNKLLRSRVYDTLIIDEASQALEAECWAAILKAKRVILAGDHKQLPPTVKNQAAAKHGLSETLLTRMSPAEINPDHEDGVSFLLRRQYRMNDKILSFSNEQFYEGLLFSDESNANHSLKDEDKIVEFIDTTGCGFDEKFNKEFKSLSNEGEFFILTEHIIQLKEKLSGVQIGVISPYAEQVRYIRQKVKIHDELKTLDIEVDTIDGFQGQEKDVIYISLVRSNEKGEIGFLKDHRRLNVAMTRAKKKLVIIGDSATLSSDKVYLKLIEHIESHNHYRSAWEFMS